MEYRLVDLTCDHWRWRAHGGWRPWRRSSDRRQADVWDDARGL